VIRDGEPRSEFKTRRFVTKGEDERGYVCKRWGGTGESWVINVAGFSPRAEFGPAKAQSKETNAAAYGGGDENGREKKVLVSISSCWLGPRGGYAPTSIDMWANSSAIASRARKKRIRNNQREKGGNQV